MDGNGRDQVSQAAGSPLVPSAVDAELEGKNRNLEGRIGLVARVALALYAFYFVASGFVGTQPAQQHRGLFLGGGAILAVIVYRPGKRPPRVISSAVDGLLVLGAMFAFGYYLAFHGQIAARQGAPSTMDIAAAVVAVIVVIEVARRTAGIAVPIIAVLALAYTFFGDSIPGILQHAGYGLERVTSTTFTSFNGIFGTVAAVFADYVVIFVVFGAFLARSGASDFFVRLPLSVAGHLRGGPAKVAVLVSAMMGSISGSATANVMTTGTFTIPLMRRLGYSREFAGGVEAAASTGGQILPPVMGAAAFLLAEFTGTPYSRVVLVSIIPAALYFAGVYIAVDMRAALKDLRGTPRHELENPWDVLREGWYYFAPVVIVFGLILSDRDPASAAFWGIVASIVVGVIPSGGAASMRLPEIMDALTDAGKQSVVAGGIAGAIGIVIGAFSLTGLGLRFSSIVVQVAEFGLLAALGITAIVSFILGAGVAVTASYVIVALLAAPALVELGIDPLVAHLVILWLSQDGNVTPPVCVPAFAAASLSGGRPMATGWEAWKLARGMYVVPILMVYDGLVGGDASTVALAAVLGLASLMALNVGFGGYLYAPINLLLRGVAVVIGVGFLFPQSGIRIVSAVVGVAIFIWCRSHRGDSPSYEASEIGLSADN